MKFFYAFILFFVFSAFAQEFMITNDGGESPILDPFTGEIYYYTNYTNIVKKLSPDLQTVEITNFPSLPYFSGIYHVAAYQGLITPELQKLYLYNFENHNSKLLAIFEEDSAIGSQRELSFSPSSQRILIKDIGAGFFSFADSAIHYVNPGWVIPHEKIYWANNDSIVYYTLHGEGVILSYNYNSQSIDTVVSYSQPVQIETFDYNITSNKIAYELRHGIENDLHILDLNTERDTCIFKSSNSIGAFKFDIAFHPSGRQLVFSTFVYLGLSWGPLYHYDFERDSLQLLEYLDEQKKGLCWVNEDTVIYSKGLNYGLYGYSISNSSNVKNQKMNIIQNIKLHQNYPNPFNSLTNIAIEIPRNNSIVLEVISIDGKKVKTLYKGVLNSGMHKFIWDGTNNSYKEVASGVYFLTLNYNNKDLRNVTTKKIIYLK